MAVFRVWCRADNVAPNQYLAVVTAIPDNPHSAGMKPESESRLVPTRALAHEACSQMVVSMRERLERRGDSVTRVDFV
jgi:hypothetical protein